MKKILIFILVLLISLNFVNAIGLSTIQMVGGQLGIKFPPEYEMIVCAVQSAKCIQDQLGGQIAQFNPISKLKQEAYEQAWNMIPEDVQEIYKTYNEFNLYVNQVKGIVKDLKVDFDGNVNSGCIEVGEGASKKTTCFKGEIKPIYNEETKEWTYTFSKEGSEISVNKVTYANIKPAEDGTRAYIKTDANGNVIEAELTTSDKLESTPLVFGDKRIDVPKDTKVIFKNGELILEGDPGKKTGDIKFYNNYNPNNPIPSNYDIDYGKGGKVVFTGDGLDVSSGVRVTDTNLHYSVLNENKDNLFITNNINNVKDKKNWIVANDKLLEYNTVSVIDLEQGNNWIKVEDGETLKLRTNGHGSIFDNGMHIQSGETISITSSKGCSSEIKYTTIDVILGSENDVSCVPMSTFSEEGNYIYIVDKDGSATLETCEENSNKIIGKSVFDVITGNFIRWITGMQAVAQKGNCVTQLVMNEKYYKIPGNGITCPGYTSDSKIINIKNDCYYTKLDYNNIYGLCETAKKNLELFPTDPNVIKTQKEVCGLVNTLYTKIINKDSSVPPVEQRDKYSELTQVAKVTKQELNIADNCQLCKNKCYTNKAPACKLEQAVLANRNVCTAQKGICDTITCVLDCTET